MGGDMGIDAELIVAVPGEKPTEAQLKRWGWKLMATLGGDKFFHSHKDGRAAVELAQGWDENGEDTGEPGKAARFDADPLVAKPGEWLVRVNTFTRYYAEGYERGDIIFLCAVAEWWEHNVPGCTVWYAGDSSGVEFQRFDDARRRELRAHLYGPQGLAYYKSWDLFMDAARGTPDPCSICIPGEPRFICNGGGQGSAFMYCQACQRNWKQQNKGPWIERKKGEW